MEREMRDEILAARRRLLEAEVRLELLMKPTHAVSQLFPGHCSLPSYDHRREAIEKEMIREEIIAATRHHLEHAIGFDRRLSFTRPETHSAGLIPQGKTFDCGLSLHSGTMGASVTANEYFVDCPSASLSCLQGQKHDNISGSKKKKAESPPPGEMVNEKKAKTGWSCAVCRIDSTSEKALNDHLQGKKHKAKEATSGIKSESPSLGNKKNPNDWSCAICRISSNSEKALNGHLQGRKHKANEAAAVAGGGLRAQKEAEGQSTTENSKVRKRYNRRYRYWCDLCKMGAHNMQTFLKHKTGNRHIGRTRESRFERCDRIRYTRDQLIQLREVVVQVPEDVLKLKQEVEAEFCGANPSLSSAQEPDLNSQSDELKRKTNSLLEEYFNEMILDEALQCVEELMSPAYHPELVREAILVALEKSPPRVELVLNLLTSMFVEKVINANDIRMGCLVYAESLEDLPKAPDRFGDIVGGLVLAGVLDFKVVSEILAKVGDDFYGKAVFNGAMKVVGSGRGGKEVLESQADGVKACENLF